MRARYVPRYRESHLMFYWLRLVLRAVDKEIDFIPVKRGLLTVERGIDTANIVKYERTHFRSISLNSLVGYYSVEVTLVFLISKRRNRYIISVPCQLRNSFKNCEA